MPRRKLLSLSADGESGPFEEEVLAAERAFAHQAAREGIRTAFLAVLAEDAMVLGEGPELGRPAYEALPGDFPGLLQWEPLVAGAAADGTLAFTSGPYHLVDPDGDSTRTGVYFSVWRRPSGSGRLELVLDFGSRGAPFPESGQALGHMRTRGPGIAPEFLAACVRQGRCPPEAGALLLGDPAPELARVPWGFHLSRDGTLGALWGARTRADGSPGAFILMLGSGAPEPHPLAAIRA